MRTDVVDARGSNAQDSRTGADPNNSQKQSAQGRSLPDVLIVLLLLVFISGIFWKTAFLGEPISKLARLTQWDSAFSGLRSGTNGLMDPSLVQLMLPYYAQVAQLWHTGQFPVWNHFSACGVPLLADPQSQVFSPLHAVLAAAPSFRLYNLILLCELWIAAGGTFLFTRTIGAGRLPAILAAVSFAFCPFIDWFLELLGSSYVFYPAVFWLFTRAVQKPTVGRAAAAGAAIAAMILSGHPEVSFFGAAFGALYAATSFFLGLADPILTNKPARKAANERTTELDEIVQPSLSFKWAPLAARQVGISAAVAFCLTAPMLLPFMEYVRNAECYKIGGKGFEFIPWQLLLVNLFQPIMQGASLYLGILPLISLPFCFALSDRRLKRTFLSLAVVALAAEAVTARIVPLSVGEISVIPNYCQPVVLLMLSVAGAIGFEQLLRSDLRLSNRTGKLLFAAGSIAVLVPLVMRLLNLPIQSFMFDDSLGDIELRANTWWPIALATFAICTLLSFRSAWRTTAAKVAAATACIALSFCFQFREAAHGLQVQPKFDYPPVELTTELQANPGRYITVGQHLLKPNTNLAYSLNSLQFHNPIFPNRYRNFMQACGARLDGFNQTFEPPFTPMIGLASTTRVVSAEPVWSDEITRNLVLQQPPSPCTWPNISLVGVVAVYDPTNRQVTGKLRWDRQRGVSRDWSYSIAVLDSHGAVLWFGDQHDFLSRIANDHAPHMVRRQRTGASHALIFDSSFGGRRFIEREFGAAIPRTTATGPLTIGVQVFDNKICHFVPPTSANAIQNRTCPIATLSTSRATAPDGTTTSAGDLARAGDPQLQLLAENTNSRVYANKSALPEAYLVHSAQPVPDGDTALKAIGDPFVQHQTSAIVEIQVLPPQFAAALSAPPASKPNAADTVKLRRKSSTQIKITTTSSTPSLLVLTDTFFPGWQATVDGAPAKIYRTNYLFRGIFLPAGTHMVSFKYTPFWLYVGLSLAALCLAFLALVQFLRTRV